MCSVDDDGCAASHRPRVWIHRRNCWRRDIGERAGGRGCSVDGVHNNIFHASSSLGCDGGNLSAGGNNIAGVGATNNNIGASEISSRNGDTSAATKCSGGRCH